MKPSKNILICIDRDGTLIYDDSYHLGSQKNWKSLIRILPNIIRGLKLLRKNIPESKIYFITNQPGVGIKQFPLLTNKKAHEVCEYILKKFAEKGFKFDGYEVCSKASPEYVKRKKGKYTFNKRFVGNYSCIKPKAGMIKSILKKENLLEKDTEIYVVGDRKSDIQTALNINGFGILVPFVNRPEEKNKVKRLKSNKIYLSKEFLDACKFIIKRYNLSLT